MFGILGGLGSFTFGYGDGAAYLKNDPQACANCHVMQASFDTWVKSSHRAAATCNDCHLAHSPITKWITKAENWPHHFDGWRSTAGDRFHGGSSALPDSKLTSHPWLKRLYAGYAFSIDYREGGGHAYMLYDQGVTERVTKKPQTRACLHCHASISVLYRKTGLVPVAEASFARLSDSVAGTSV